MDKIGRFLRRLGRDTMKSFRGELSKPQPEEMLFNFRDEKVLSKWTCNCDSLFGGLSKAEIKKSRSGALLFTGNTSTDTSGNKAAKYFGFATMKSDLFRNDFDNPEPMRVTDYSGIEIKFRGDGRAYTVNIEPKIYGFPVNEDRYQSILFTRGGPHWEVNRISFVNFMLTTQGYLQDNQFQEFHNMKCMSVSLHDRNTGPFSFEIDYIKLLRTPFQPYKIDRVHQNTYTHLIPEKHE